MINNVDDFVILLLDGKGNIKSGSNNIERIRGYKPADVIGSHINVLYDAEGQNIGLPETLINEATINGNAVYEGWSTRKDGTKFWSQIIITALYNKQGVLSGFSKITDDLTSHIETEESSLLKSTTTFVAKNELLKSESRFRALIENSFDAITVIDENGIMQYLSPSAERMIGAAHGEMLDTIGFDIFHPDDKPEILKRIQEVIQNPGVPIFRTNRIRHKDGHYIWTEGTTTNLLHDENIRGIVGNFRDITERKKSEAYLKAIFENSSESLILTDTAGTILTFNDNAQQTNLLTCALEMRPGLNMLDFIAESRKDIFKEILARVVMGESVRYDQSFTDIEGRFYCFDFSIFPVKEDGVVTSICYNGRDITHRKNAEEKILRANNLYAFISNIDKTIVRAKSKETVFSDACRIAVEMGKFKIAWVGLFNKDKSRINCVAETGIPAEDIEMFTNAVINKLSPQAYVLEENKSFLGNDVFNDVNLPGWKKYAQLRGLASFMILPIRQGNQITGSLNLYATEKQFFDTPEIELLEEVTEDISFALDVFDREEHRKQIEEKLTHSELRLNQAQSIAHIGSWEYDFNSAHLVCSDEYCKIYGLQEGKNTLTLDEWFTFVHPDDLAVVTRKVKEGEDNLSNSIFDYRILRADGIIKHIHTQTNFEFNSAGVPAGIYGIVHDISGRKEAEEKIINANRLYAFISQINQTIVQVGDETTLFNKVCQIATDVGKFDLAWISLPDSINKTLNIAAHSNASASDLELLHNLTFRTDGPIASVLQSNNYYVINDLGHQSVNREFREYALQRGLKSCIVLPIMKSGKTIGAYNLVSSKVNLFDEEEIALLTEATNDISFALSIFEKEKQRKQIEEKLGHSELRLKQAQSIARIGSWEYDFSEGITVGSEEYCHIYGRDIHNNKFTDEEWFSFVHPDDLAYVTEIMEQSEITLTNYSFDYRILLPVNTIKYIHSQTNFEFDTQGIAVGCHGIAHDVTALKLAEAERTKMIADIVQRNKDLEQFSYIVSHNLRSPVANISGLAQILQMTGANNANASKYVSELTNSVKKLDDVIMDLNYILQVKQKEIKRIEPVKFSLLLEDITTSIDNLIKSDNVKIVSDFSQVDDMLTFKTYLYSIFINIISNSIKYRQPDIQPLIEISSTKEDNKIVLIFKDNGLGIDLSKKGNQVFGLYKRFHDHVAGKGMGLYMVKTQVESLGGKISIASEVNKGTEFRIEFEIS